MDVESPVPPTMPTIDGFRPMVLAVMADGQTRRLREIYAAVKNHAHLTDAQRAEVLTSGDSRADNRIGWACSSLTVAGALDRPIRATYSITPLGRDLLKRFPDSMSEKDLVGLPGWDAHLARLREKKGAAAPKDAGTGQTAADAAASASTPDEVIEAAVAANDAEVAADLLQRLREGTPDFFEQVVLDVLVAMGYGGTTGRASRLGQSGDGGVDGVVEQDALGLQNIYVQAKRYGEGNAVGRPELQGFIGALTGREADRGVFITTSTFTASAKEYARAMRGRMVTIDGTRLTSLMIRYRVGVQARRTYDLVEVDEDYFE
jgi:restriction system protein